MDVQKDLLDLCPDMISPQGVRLLNTPLCQFVYKDGESVLRVNRTHTEIPPILDSMYGMCSSTSRGPNEHKQAPASRHHFPSHHLVTNEPLICRLPDQSVRTR